MSTISKRRQQVHRELELTTDKEIQNMERAMAKEETRQERKWQRQMEIEESSSYSLIKNIVKYMDNGFLTQYSVSSSLREVTYWVVYSLYHSSM